MTSVQQFSLRWNNYLRHVISVFDNLRVNEDLVDVTLCCEGKKIKAHKMLLSACSSYFRDIFKENPCQHPVIIFRNVKYDDLLGIINFMYHGEVNILQEQLASFLTTADLLEVQGLTDDSENKNQCNDADKDMDVIKVSETPDVHQISYVSESRKRKAEIDTDELWSYEKNELINSCNPKVENIIQNDVQSEINTETEIPVSLEISNQSTQEVGNEVPEEQQSSHAIQLIPSDSMQEMGSDATLKDVAQGEPLRPINCANKIRVDENGVKVYKCEKCAKSFKHPLSLSQHVKIHSGVTKCTICYKILSRVHDLKLHQATVHGIKK